MFEGDFADMCAISSHVDGGPSRGSWVRRPGSEDPHRREQNLYGFFVDHPLCLNISIYLVI